MPDLTDRDAAFKERELDLRAQEVELKRAEFRRSRWANPIFVALIVAIVAAFGNMGVAWYNGAQQRLIEAEKADRAFRLEADKADRTLRLEAEKAESARVLAVIGSDTERVAANLDFLTRSGLYSDQKGLVRDYLAKRKKGEGPSLPPPASASASVAPQVDSVLFDNWNSDGVARQGDGASPEFTVPRDHYVTYISNYHWNIAPGRGGGTMHLMRVDDGTFYAPCQAATSPGQDNKPDVNWFCRPNVRIPAGRYQVKDSDPGTWSHNSKSAGRGFSRVRGYPAD